MIIAGLLFASCESFLTETVEDTMEEKRN